MSDRRPFLTARWQHLVMLNFAVDPDGLAPLVPEGTELDDYNGRCLVSVVAFEFADAKFFGLRVPGFQLFPEVNLRFYVRRWTGSQWRRGVVFINELVPRRLVVAVARHMFGQSFSYARMFHRLTRSDAGEVTDLRYRWNSRRCPCHVSAEVSRLSNDPEHTFVAEHYYAYAKSSRGSLEYRVEHPPWRVYHAVNVSHTLYGCEIYGQQIGRSLLKPASSVLIADGSAVSVYPGLRFRAGEAASDQGRCYDLVPCS
jgi:uncharacterized protein